MKQKYPVVLIAGLGGLFTCVHLASAQTWSPTGAPAGRWKTVACSADGTRLVAGEGRITCPYNCYYDVSPLYTSADSGLTWTQTGAPSNHWSSVASAADGTKLVAAAGDYQYGLHAGPLFGPIYTSTNCGATWTQTLAPSNCWSSVASSADGTKLVAATLLGPQAGSVYSAGLIYTSQDSGVTWKQTSAPSNAWTAVASSADGSKLVAVSWGFPLPGDGRIYTSTNSGVTWMQTGAANDLWISVASSADGSKLVAAIADNQTYYLNYYPGPIYTSTNSGITWAQTTAPEDQWTSVASSADGTKLIAVASYLYDGPFSVFDGLVYISENSGLTWTANELSGRLASVACSADGGKLMAAANHGLIYCSQSTPAPLLSLSPSASGLGISWLVPSTCFVLQQNSDLTTTNWTDVAVTPTLNFTNLHYEVSVSPTDQRNFYRLKQH